MTREQGYYWCRDSSGWEVAKWDSQMNWWYRVGWDVPENDDVFYEIDETPITREDENT